MLALSSLILGLVTAAMSTHLCSRLYHVAYLLGVGKGGSSPSIRDINVPFSLLRAESLSKSDI